MDIYSLPDALKEAWHSSSLAGETSERNLEPMYKTILLTLDGTSTDRAIIEHVKPLAKWANSRVVLLHVADGWAARTFGPDAVSPGNHRGHGLSGENPR